MTHPLIDAVVEVDCAAHDVLKSVDSTRVRMRLRDAIGALRGEVLSVVAVQAADGKARLDIDTFKAIVRRYHELGLDWPAMVEAFNDVREGS